MSRHVPRHARWNKLGPSDYTAACGAVRYERGAWWACLAYRECEADPTSDVLLEWHEREERIGPFKRPRNAMMAAEERVTLLQRRLGDRVIVHPGEARPPRY
jgi:hypothetical protein